MAQRAKKRQNPDSPAEESAEETVAEERIPARTGATEHRETLKPRNGKLNSTGESRYVLVLYFVLVQDGNSKEISV